MATLIPDHLGSRRSLIWPLNYGSNQFRKIYSKELKKMNLKKTEAESFIGEGMVRWENQWPGPLGLGPDDNRPSQHDIVFFACSYAVGYIFKLLTLEKSPGTTLAASTAALLLKNATTTTRIIKAALNFPKFMSQGCGLQWRVEWRQGVRWYVWEKLRFRELNSEMKGRCSMKCLRENEVERRYGWNEAKVFDEMRERQRLYFIDKPNGWGVVGGK